MSPTTEQYLKQMRERECAAPSEPVPSRIVHVVTDDGRTHVLQVTQLEVR